MPRSVSPQRLWRRHYLRGRCAVAAAVVATLGHVVVTSTTVVATPTTTVATQWVVIERGRNAPPTLRPIDLTDRQQVGLAEHDYIPVGRSTAAEGSSGPNDLFYIPRAAE